LTRGGNPISACDTKTSKCVQAAPAGCTTDASCFTPTQQAIVGSAADVCSDGECACFKETGGCYRKCSEALDCPVGYSCDKDTSLCMPQGSCTTDAQCINRSGDSRLKCVDGTCTQPPCEHDIDCNPGGLIDGFFSSVCGPEKVCVDLGCSSDDECGTYRNVEGGVRSFCATVPTTKAAPAPVSAITD